NQPHEPKAFTWPDHSILTECSMCTLRSKSDHGFYIGFSTNLRCRLRQHQNGDSFTTARRGPWKLIYDDAYLTQEDCSRTRKISQERVGQAFLRAQLRQYLSQEPIARPRGPAA